MNLSKAQFLPSEMCKLCKNWLITALVRKGALKINGSYFHYCLRNYYVVGYLAKSGPLQLGKKNVPIIQKL